MDTLKFSRFIINGITCYRIVAAPVLLWLILKGQLDIFKWLLTLSFLTDAVDGYLARRYRVVSLIGARMDSIGDDLTVGMAIIGLLNWHFDFISSHWLWASVLTALFCLHLIMGLVRYGKLTAFHTYTAKAAAVLQAVFLLASFFFSPPSLLLFYLVAALTGLGLLEEIVLIVLLPDYRFNVKGLFWVLKDKRVQRS